METDDIIGRLAVVEMIAMTSLGLHLANSRNDPDLSKVNALLAHMQHQADRLALSPRQQAYASAHAAHLLKEVQMNIRQLFGGTAAPH